MDPENNNTNLNQNTNQINSPESIPAENLTNANINISSNSNKFPLKGTVILIICLALVTSFFVYIAIKPKSTQTPQQIVKIPTPTPYAQSVLSLDQETSTSAAKIIDVNIDTAANAVTAVQLEIAFDPKAINKITLEKGTFFSNPIELLNNVNYNDGRITYALGLTPKQNGIKGTGTVAKILYTTNSNATSSATTFSILPKSLVTSEGVVFSTLKSTADLTVPLSLQPSIASPSSQ